MPTLQLLRQLLLLGDIHPCPNEPLESLTVSRWNAHATDATNLSIGPHNPFREIESAMGYQHLLNFLHNGFPIFRVDEGQILFYRRGLAARTKAMDPNDSEDQYSNPVG